MNIYSKRVNFLEQEFGALKYQHGEPRREVYHVCEKLPDHIGGHTHRGEVCPYCQKEVPPLVKLQYRISV